MSALFKKHLSRRTFIRGVGVTMSLPFLDAMVPARTALAQTAAKPQIRLGLNFIPHGAVMNQWTPAADGPLQLSPTLTPLAPHKDQVVVLSNLAHAMAGPQGAGDNGGDCQQRDIQQDQQCEWGNHQVERRQEFLQISAAKAFRQHPGAGGERVREEPSFPAAALDQRVAAGLRRAPYFRLLDEQRRATGLGELDAHPQILDDVGRRKLVPVKGRPRDRHSGPQEVNSASQPLKRPLPNNVPDEKGKGGNLDCWGRRGSGVEQIGCLARPIGRHTRGNQPLEAGAVDAAIRVDDHDQVWR